MAGLERLPALLQLREAHQARVAVAAHPAWIVVDDVLEARTSRLHVEELVDLLLVLDDGEPGLGVIDDELDLFLDGVLVDGYRDAAQSLGRHDRPVELRPVVADDGDPVAAREPERGEALRDEAGLIEVRGPRVHLPDPQVLLPDRDLVGSAAGIEPDELGKVSSPSSRPSASLLRAGAFKSPPRYSGCRHAGRQDRAARV